MPRKLALMSAFLDMDGPKNSRPPVKSRSRDEVRVASTFLAPLPGGAPADNVLSSSF